MTLIKADNLCKTYGSGENLVNAVNQANLEIKKGEIIGIVGKSGSGKTTLLHLLSGLDSPTSGRILYENKRLDMQTEKELTQYRSKHIGFVFQFFNLLPILSVQENIYLPLMINGEEPDEDYINSLVDLLEIRSKLHMRVNKLSGGQQQRVAIARALSHKPKLLFADEPTGALDTATSYEIMQLLKDVSIKFGQTLIVVTHDPIVANQCNRIITLEDGKIISDVQSEAQK